MAKSQILRLRRAKVERILITTSNDFRLQRAIIFQNFRLRQAYIQGILVTIPKKSPNYIDELQQAIIF